ncbi:hypothetical protein PV797_07355 [Clostridiaceae bacterium M8S5]|nr:hypothetical protein PV797_07355 [Clostridiaceae bacterium M8S5]
MQTDVENISDNTVLNIQEVFNLIQNYKYEEAFLLSSQIMKRSEDGDQLFHEWVKALAEFYSCDKKRTAINLLEKVKPEKLINEIHFRIINSLMGFYIEIEDELNFLNYKKELISNLCNLNNNEILVKILSNIANGYYVFKNYEESLKYCEKTIKTVQHNKHFDMSFTTTLILKITNMHYQDKIDEAKVLQKDFEIFLKMTDGLNNKKYLDKTIENYYKEVENNEKNISKSL